MRREQIVAPFGRIQINFESGGGDGARLEQPERTEKRCESASGLISRSSAEGSDPEWGLHTADWITHSHSWQ
jgi:hypothetical protein